MQRLRSLILCGFGTIGGLSSIVFFANDAFAELSYLVALENKIDSSVDHILQSRFEIGLGVSGLSLGSEAVGASISTLEIGNGITRDQGETKVTESLSVDWDSWQAGLSGGGVVGNSRFNSLLLGASIGKAWNQQTTRLKVGLSKGWFEQPQESYVDLNFRTRMRPDAAVRTDLSVGAEQILTETWKIKADANVFEISETRPWSSGFLIEGVYAVNERIAVGMLAETAFALGVVSPSDRGKLSLYGLGASLRVQWAHNWVSELFCEFGNESETRQTKATDINVQTHFVSLGNEFETNFGSLFIKTGLAISSTLSPALGGGIQWSL